ncbi:SHIRT domain-containing protein [Schaalia sp. ZJ1691]|uniref:SHIRT domain-containing protein n=1 Tax=Schaalia sp. ZJ1691 TaxID=2709404 RepID=UPI0013EC93CD|nr:SHIRT domain-containing protein [Schaalia sp. ZJ1691]
MEHTPSLSRRPLRRYVGLAATTALASTVLLSFVSPTYALDREAAAETAPGTESLVESGVDRSGENTPADVSTDGSNGDTAGADETPEAPSGSASGSDGATESTDAPQPAPAENSESAARTNNDAPSYAGTVSLVGQWTDESTRRVDTQKEYVAATDKIGGPVPNQGSFRHLGKIFLGWSDQAPDSKTGALAPGARLFSAEDTISTAFPTGIGSDARLYGVYFSLTTPLDAPLPRDNLSLGLALLGGMNKITTAFGSSSVEINPGLRSDNTEEAERVADQTLPNTQRYSVEKTVTDKIATTTITDLYEHKDDTSTIHEVALRSEFTMNNEIAMLVYRNPPASNAYLPVLSRDYSKLLSGDAELSTASGKAAGYTYVDLDVSLGKGIVVPEVLNLEFSGYSWRPLYVLDEKRKPLPIVNPTTGEDLGATKTSFASLISNNNPNVRFGVKTHGTGQLTVRVILRHGPEEKIPESSVVATPGSSIAETILQKMTLRSLGTQDLGADAKNQVLRINDATALQLANDEIAPLKATGTVSGLAVADVGPIGSGFFSLPTKNALAVGPFRANIVALDYHRLYTVTYEFAARDGAQTLPKEVMALLPSAQSGKEKGDVITLTKPASVVTPEGTWEFVGWYADAYTPESQAVTEVTVGADHRLVGVWNFVEKPEETTPEEPEEITPETPEEITPETPEETTPEAPEETVPENPNGTTPQGPGASSPQTPGGTSQTPSSVKKAKGKTPVSAKKLAVTGVNDLAIPALALLGLGMCALITRRRG